MGTLFLGHRFRPPRREHLSGLEFRAGVGQAHAPVSAGGLSAPVRGQEVHCCPVAPAPSASRVQHPSSPAPQLPAPSKAPPTLSCSSMAQDSRSLPPGTPSRQGPLPSTRTLARRPPALRGLADLRSREPRSPRPRGTPSAAASGHSAKRLLLGGRWLLAWGERGTRCPHLRLLLTRGIRLTPPGGGRGGAEAHLPLARLKDKDARHLGSHFVAGN